MITTSVFLAILVICIVLTQNSFHVEAKGTKKESADQRSSSTTNGLPYFVPEAEVAVKDAPKAGKDTKGSMNDSTGSSTQDAGTIYFPQADATDTSKNTKSGKDNKATKESKAPKGGKEPKAGKESKAPKGASGGKESKAPKSANNALKETKAPKDGKTGKDGKDGKESKAPKSTKNGKDTKAPKGKKGGKKTQVPKATRAPTGTGTVETVTLAAAARECPFQPSGGANLNPSTIGGNKPASSGRGILNIAFDSGFTQMDYSIFIAEVPAINAVTLNCISSGNSTNIFVTSLSHRDPGSSYASILNGANLMNTAVCEDGSVISNVVGLYDVMRRGLIYVEASVVDPSTGENPVFIRGDVQVATTPGTC